MSSESISFLRDLAESGRVKLSGDAPFPAANEHVDRDLRALDRAARLEMAHDPPPIMLDPAKWAAGLVHEACRLLICRELGSDAVAAAFARKCPAAPSPSVCYSVDLTLRYLPGLISMSRGLAEDDPLVTALMETARRWPLSSVGVAGIGEIDVSPFISHPALRRLYVDRIIEQRDLARVSHPLVRETVKTALGSFPSLAPEIAAAIAGEEPA